MPKFQAFASFILQLGEPATKHIRLNEHGQLEKRPPAFRSGLVMPRLLSAESLCQQVADTRRKFTFLKWAVPVSGPTPAWVLMASSAKDEANAQSVIARLKTHFKKHEDLERTIQLGDFERAAGPGWFAIDIDPAPGVEGLSEAQAVKILAEVIPRFENAARVVYQSSSSHLYEKSTGRELAGQRGLRVVVGIKNAGDTRRAGLALFNRLWLAGHGWTVFQQTGKVAFKTLVDLAVTKSASQPDFYLPGVLEGDLEYRAPAPTWQDGEALDTEILIPSLNATEQAQLKAIQDTAQSLVQAESEQRMQAYILERVAAETAAGADKEQAHARIQAALASTAATVEVSADFIVQTRALGAVTMREIGERGIPPDPYCADLNEPTYGAAGNTYTTTKAVIQTAVPGFVQIKSFAHNGCTYRWVEGAQTAPDFSIDATTEPATWLGTGADPTAWEQSTELALARAAQIEASFPGLDHTQTERLRTLFHESNTTRGLRYFSPKAPSDIKFSSVLQDLIEHASHARGNHVMIERRDRTNSVVFTYLLKEGAPEPFATESESAAKLSQILAAEDGTKHLETVVGGATLTGVIDAIVQARTLNPALRLEIFLPTQAARAGMQTALEARGFLVALRPSRTSLDEAGEPLCVKIEAIQSQIQAGVTSEFFSNHCLKSHGPLFPPEVCPAFSSCGYNLQMKTLMAVDIVISLSSSLASRPNTLLETTPSSRLVVFSLDSSAEPIKWAGARMRNSDCTKINPIVLPLLTLIAAGVGRAAVLDSISREDLAALTQLARPPLVARPRYTKEQAARAARRLARYKITGTAAPWAIAKALCDYLNGQGAIGYDASTDQYHSIAKAQYDRAAMADTVVLISPDQPAPAALDSIAAKLDDSGALTRSSFRMPVAPIPGRIVLSKYPRIAHTALVEPKMVEGLADMLKRSQRAGVQTAVIVHSTELHDALSEALAQWPCADRIQISTPNRLAKVPAAGFGLIVTTAASPSTKLRFTKHKWHSSQSSETFQDAIESTYAYRAPVATLWKQGDSVTGIVQTMPLDDTHNSIFQASAYEAVEALALASASVGATPVVILLDTVIPAWPVDAIVPRDRLVPGRRERAVIEVWEDNLGPSVREVSRLAFEKHPDLFTSESAAREVSRSVLDRKEAALGRLLELWDGKYSDDLPQLVAELEDLAQAELEAEEAGTEAGDAENSAKSSTEASHQPLDLDPK